MKCNNEILFGNCFFILPLHDVLDINTQRCGELYRNTPICYFLKFRNALVHVHTSNGSVPMKNHYTPNGFFWLFANKAQVIELLSATFMSFGVPTLYTHRCGGYLLCTRTFFSF